MIDWETLRTLEGHCVSVALCDGSRVDHAELVCAGRTGAESLWLFANGRDLFVRRDDVRAVWESNGCDAAA